MSVLHVIAQAPDASGWNVTTTLSAIAASISLVTLVVTTYFAGRRETVKWAREALAQAYYEFVDVSFAAGQAFHERQKLFWGRPSEYATADAATQDAAAKEMGLRHAQTRIRLLAPTATIELANATRMKYKDIVKQSTAQTTEAEHKSRRNDLRDAREAFLEQAKIDMSLPK